MNYKCKHCEVEFEFNKKDIKEEIRITKEKENTSRSTKYKLLKKSFIPRFNEYGSEVTFTDDIYEIKTKWKFIVCPVCEFKNDLAGTEISKEKVDTRTSVINNDPWDTFGPNPPCICGPSAFNWAAIDDFDRRN